MHEIDHLDGILAVDRITRYSNIVYPRGIRERTEPRAPTQINPTLQGLTISVPVSAKSFTFRVTMARLCSKKRGGNQAIGCRDEIPLFFAFYRKPSRRSAIALVIGSRLDSNQAGKPRIQPFLQCGATNAQGQSSIPSRISPKVTTLANSGFWVALPSHRITRHVGCGLYELGDNVCNRPETRSQIERPDSLFVFPVSTRNHAGEIQGGTRQDSF